MIPDDLISFLRTRGEYTSAPNSISLLGMHLSFEAVMIGPRNHDGLLLVERPTGATCNLLLNKMKAFSLALERCESARTLTLILLGGKLDPSVHLELSRVCRLLLVAENDSFDLSLAAILPLILPDSIAADITAEATLESELHSDSQNPFVQKLIKAARTNEGEVQTLIRNTVDELSQLSASQ